MMGLQYTHGMLEGTLRSETLPYKVLTSVLGLKGT